MSDENWPDENWSWHIPLALCHLEGLKIYFCFFWTCFWLQIIVFINDCFFHFHFRFRLLNSHKNTGLWWVSDCFSHFYPFSGRLPYWRSCLCVTFPTFAILSVFFFLAGILAPFPSRLFLCGEWLAWPAWPPAFSFCCSGRRTHLPLAFRTRTSNYLLSIFSKFPSIGIGSRRFGDSAEMPPDKKRVGASTATSEGRFIPGERRFFWLVLTRKLAKLLDRLVRIRSEIGRWPYWGLQSPRWMCLPCAAVPCSWKRATLSSPRRSWGGIPSTVCLWRSSQPKTSTRSKVWGLFQWLPLASGGERRWAAGDGGSVSGSRDATHS